MNLDVKNWNYFTLGDLFDFQKGKRLTKSDMISGNVNFLGAISENNGIREKIDIPKNELWEPNCITVNYNGSVGEAFHQDEPFWASDDVNVLYAKGWEMNKYNALFLCTIIKQEQYRFCYGRKWTLEKMKESKIKLPVTTTGSPDWNFMECFIKSLHHKLITTKITKKPASPDTSKWQRFRFGDIISSINKAQAYNDDYLINSDPNSKDSVPYITRTDEKNGVKSFVKNQELTGIQSGNAIVIGDTTATVSYQENDFICGDHIVVIRADWLNKFTGLFIVTLLRKESYRYSYGRAFKMDIIKNTVLKLPTTKDGTPDYIFMENYIKSLPYSDRI
ncbi:restriction endonuclease subunit S [uncultured Treponema sp.]|uniref:restriction endonuclease subunit S n=1 Tax=uncultured Treponema sp. TaxID=162155 RepID=UPI0025F45328|nr:restriction endonuclease subunit S [uncultured Treponema sp.]